MTDNITRILANAKEVSKTKDDSLSCTVVEDKGNGIQTTYTLEFEYNGIILKKNILENGKCKTISSTHEYNKEAFFFVLRNFNNLIGNIYKFNNNVNFTPNTIPTMVFSNSVFKKKVISDYDGETYVYEGDKYTDDFITYNNRNYFINENNYFTFLKFATEVEYFQIFAYLLLEYPDYVKNLNEEQIAILTYTSFKKDPSFSDRIADLGFKFGFELLKLAVYNNDYEVLEYLCYNGIDINAVKYGQTILDYAFGENNNIEMVEFLIDHNIKIFDGHSIVEYTKRNPTIVESLFKREDINDILKIKYNKYGWSVAHIIAGNENLEIIKLLFKREDINDILKIKTGEGWSVAHEIAENENPEVVKLLFERENIADILKMKNLDGWSVAHVIARNKNPEIVKLLFERENISDILRMKGNNDNSVAYVIARNENPEVAKLLLNHEDIELKKEVIDLIKRNFSNNEEIMDLLLARELIDANNATEEVNTITENETPEEMNTCKMCTIC